jgi:NitT/TauT family transport system permease protein
VFGELWSATALVAPNKPRSLLFHAWVTFSATALGFVMGSILGIGLAVLIVHNEAMNRSLMPWIVASQTIPILALAPLIVVIGFNIFTGTMGIPTDPARLMSKAIISAYLSFFPVAVGMVKGLRSPETIQLDLMHTYSATPGQTFWKLRWPASMPFLFASLKVGVAASLVGAIVGELPTGAVAGLGARLLAGSYYSQTVQIWAALFAASILAALLVIAVGLVERLVVRSMGARPA